MERATAEGKLLTALDAATLADSSFDIVECSGEGVGEAQLLPSKRMPWLVEDWTMSSKEPRVGVPISSHRIESPSPGEYVNTVHTHWKPADHVHTFTPLPRARLSSTFTRTKAGGQPLARTC